MRVLAILMIIASTCQANDVTFLKKGDIAGYDGYLFTPGKEKEVRIGIETADYLEKRNKALEQIIADLESRDSVVQERLKIRDAQIDTLSKRVVDSKDDGFLGKVGFFLLGAIITGGIAFGISRTINR